MSNMTGLNDEAYDLAQSTDDSVRALLFNELRHSIDSILQRKHRRV